MSANLYQHKPALCPTKCCSVAFEIDSGSDQVVGPSTSEPTKAFVTTVRNIAAERGYYGPLETPTIGWTVNGHARNDDFAFPIIDRHSAQRALCYRGFSVKDRSLLAGFVVLANSCANFAACKKKMRKP